MTQQNMFHKYRMGYVPRKINPNNVGLEGTHTEYVSPQQDPRLPEDSEIRVTTGIGGNKNLSEVHTRTNEDWYNPEQGEDTVSRNIIPSIHIKVPTPMLGTLMKTMHHLFGTLNPTQNNYIQLHNQGNFHEKPGVNMSSMGHDVHLEAPFIHDSKEKLKKTFAKAMTGLFAAQLMNTGEHNSPEAGILHDYLEEHGHLLPLDQYRDHPDIPDVYGDIRNQPEEGKSKTLEGPEKLKVDILSHFYHNLISQYIDHIHGARNPLSLDKFLSSNPSHAQILPLLRKVLKFPDHRREKI